MAGSDGLKAEVKVSPKELHNGPRALPLKHMERRLRQRACVTNQEAAGGLYTIQSAAGPLHEAATCTLALLSIILVMLYKVSSPLETRKLQNLPNA